MATMLFTIGEKAGVAKFLRALRTAAVTAIIPSRNTWGAKYRSNVVATARCGPADPVVFSTVYTRMISGARAAKTALRTARSTAATVTTADIERHGQSPSARMPSRLVTNTGTRVAD